MTTKALNRDANRIRREWSKWEGLWLRYWRLPEAWANALVDALNEVRIQRLTDRLLLDAEEGKEPSKLRSMWVRKSIEKGIRAKIVSPREPVEIDSERIELLPRLIFRLRELSFGKYRKLHNDLDQAYQFFLLDDKSRDDDTRSGASRDSVLKSDTENNGNKKQIESQEKENKDVLSLPNFSISSIRYPINTEDKVFETLEFFADIEQEIMSTFLTPEYIEKITMELKELVKEQEINL